MGSADLLCSLLLSHPYYVLHLEHCFLEDIFLVGDLLRVNLVKSALFARVFLRLQLEKFGGLDFALAANLGLLLYLTSH